MHIFKSLRKWLRWLLLLPQLVIDIATLTIVMQIIFFGQNPIIADPEGESVMLFVMQMILAAIVMIFVPRHFYKNGPPLYKGRWDTEPQEVYKSQFKGYLSSQLERPEKYIHYSSWGCKAILILCLLICTKPNLASVWDGTFDFPMDEVWMWMLTWTWLSDIVWVELYSYIKSKNSK